MINVRLTVAEAKALDKVAGMTRSAVMRAALQRYLRGSR